jgi:hypothetical protein
MMQGIFSNLRNNAGNARRLGCVPTARKTLLQSLLPMFGSYRCLAPSGASLQMFLHDAMRLGWVPQAPNLTAHPMKKNVSCAPLGAKHR